MCMCIWLNCMRLRINYRHYVSQCPVNTLDWLPNIPHKAWVDLGEGSFTFQVNQREWESNRDRLCSNPSPWPLNHDAKLYHRRIIDTIHSAALFCCNFFAYIATVFDCHLCFDVWSVIPKSFAKTLRKTIHWSIFRFAKERYFCVIY